MFAKFHLRLSRRAVLEFSAGLGLFFAVVLTCWMSSFCALADEVRANTLRLHVQANSDSEADQALKLIVRDAVLEEMGPVFAAAESEAQAAAIAEESLPQLQACVERTLQEQGSGLSARVYLTEMYFDTTYYEDFTLPAGVYDALRVELGAHAGKNWFCVLYPGLCLPAAGEAAVYPTEAQQNLVEAPKVEVRFAALEWLEHLTGGAKH
ncbi:MAG TPA: stage II sporulation protein R [Candidatus Fournierella merdipullorum]|uniref:Stage II sporulation protein R n=1 Tax=Candidatus Allofournierella merdipullorum TaxID=2838595 RepID=A0A9D2E2A7_9FIRM|nr:stage II sporulation protein R [Candidatus Fournierella merdipullorum]